MNQFYTRFCAFVSLLFMSSFAFAQTTPAAPWQPLLDGFNADGIVAAIVAVGAILLGVALTMKAVRLVLSMLQGQTR